MSGDVCIMDVSSFNPFMNIVMLNVNMFCTSMERLVMSQDIGCHSGCRMDGLEHDLRI